MKNMSVGKKILSAFIVVILMIVVILGMTILTSNSRNSDLERVDKMSALQRNANKLLENFNLARVEIRTVFTSIDAEEEYNIALSYLDTCIGILDEMDAQSDELDGYMLDNITQLRSMFADIRIAIINVGDNDEAAIASIARMLSSGTTMLASSTDLFDKVSQLALNISTEDAATAVERIEMAIIPTSTLTNAVNEVRIISRELILQQNTEILPELRSAIDSVEQQAASLRGNLTTQEARDAIDLLTSTLVEYRAAIADTETTLASSEQEIAVARQSFLALNDVVNACVDAISADVAELSVGIMKTSVTTTGIMIAISIVAAVFSVVVATFLGRIITRPLNKMKNVMLQAGETGNLHFSDEVKAGVRKEAEARDEIGSSLMAFSRLIDHITGMADLLERVANKDLTVSVELLSDTDTMGKSIKLMVDNLNETFSEIKSASTQVSTAAGEIAMGAQGLAQGSTEQAATVQQISASVAEINGQMNSSSQTVNEAASGSLQMNQIAQQGNDKMGDMTKSMQEINEASQAIGKVIKVIDDIAFQTNILALNAAVEAARAGQHGKGFAVVADEVRNLASKSADAAKETSALISTNIEKTEQGLLYVQETAESLSQIMEGILKNSQSLQLVVEQNANVTSATSQVNAAIDQVAQVVQQNSATSEESAAASEELSSQANLLQQMVAQFRLKGYGGETSKKPASEPGDDNDESGYAMGGDKY